MKPVRRWGCIDLVVFDVDGTLYDAARLRRAMLVMLLAESWRTRSLHALRTLHAFRCEREALAEEGDAEFLHLQYPRTARRLDCTSAQVRAVVREWMEQRPLPLLRACRRPGVAQVFDGLRAAGKRIGVLSDYPAQDKLQALDLAADLVVSAGDAGIGRLKPNPRGLHTLMLRAGVPPSRTLVVGDRLDRDVAVARRVGAHALLLARSAPQDVDCLRSFEDPALRPLLQRPWLATA